MIMARKNVKKKCRVCGSEEEVKWTCVLCKHPICGKHIIGLDVPMTLEQRSNLGLGGYREHPTFPLCLDDEGKGCAKKMIKGILKAVKK